MRIAIIPTAAVLGVLVAGAHAQQAKPATKAVEPSATVSLTVRGPEAKSFLSVNATSADLRTLLRDMARKIGATIYFSPSVSGTFSGTIEALDPDAAISTVAGSAACKVVRISLPKDTPTLSEAAAGKVYDGMAALPASALVSDARSKRTMVVSETAVAHVPDGSVVYYVQGKLTPDQEQAGAEKRAVDKAAQAKAPQTAIQNAVHAFQAMSPTERVQAMQDVQRQIFQSMTPQDRQAMFDAMRAQRGRGGRGGPGN